MVVLLFIIVLIVILYKLFNNSSIKHRLDEYDKEQTQNYTSPMPINITKNSTHSNSSYPYTILSEKDYRDFNNSSVYINHFKYLPIITENYKEVTKTKDYFGTAANKVIKYCSLDIDQAEDFYKLYITYNQELPRYPSFQILAMLYEYRGEIDNAISVCEKAISIGFENDGTKGKMQGRIIRLQKKNK